MNNNKKIFKFMYLLLCVIIIAIVIILCISSTQSYFAARAENTGDAIEGKALDISLELTAESISTSADNNGYLIPLDKDIESLTKAARGYGNNTSTFDNTKSCLDINGYSVCKVYEIKVTNKGGGTATINGGVTSLYGDRTPNVACVVMDNNPTTVSSNDTCIGNNTIASNVSLGGGQTLTYYLMVYINNLDTPQDDVGLFEGIVKFETQAGIVMQEIS